MYGLKSVAAKAATAATVPTPLLNVFKVVPGYYVCNDNKHVIPCFLTKRVEAYPTGLVS